MKRDSQEIGVAVVGGGQGCLQLLQLFNHFKLKKFQARILGVADPRLDAPGITYARELGLITTVDFTQFYSYPDIELLIELTGDNQVLEHIYRTKPLHIKVIDHVSAQLFWDVMWLRSEAYYQAVFENTGTATLIIEEDMTISLANAECERLFGYSKRELEGKRLSEFISKDNMEKMKEYHRLRRIDPTLASRNYESRLIDKQGNIRDVLVTAAVIPGTKRAVVSLWDITELHRINRALKVLSACNAAVVHAADESSLIHEVCQKIVEIGEYCLAWIGYIDQKEEKSVRPVAWAGYEEVNLENLKITWKDTESSRDPAGTAIRTQQLVICRDIPTSSDFIPWQAETGRGNRASVIALPLIANSDEPFALLSIYTKKENVFDTEETRLLKEIASDLAYGIMSLRARRERSDAEEKLRQSFIKLQKTLEGSIEALASAVEKRDLYTAGHQRRVAELSSAIAREMGLLEEQIQGLYLAALVHDIGKISIPAEILSKPSRLTEVEFAIIKAHPCVGFDILKKVEFPWPIAQIVLQHHERMDGSGYPNGITGKDILLEAKILAVADVVEAMVYHRPYKSSLSIDEALKEITQNKGVLYDPRVVDTCVKLLTKKGFKF